MRRKLVGLAIDDPRIDELRRRVQEDPASIVFAQLAEECRRAGQTEEAVAICRAGLHHHPHNLTARVTLGRALVEIGKLDEAFNELTSVLDAAPGNLPAIRALAEIYQRRGMMSEALVHYRRALQLAQHDTDPSQSAEPIDQSAEFQTKPEATQAAPIGELFDFDSLLAQLGSPHSAPAAPAFVPLKLSPQPSVVDTTVPDADDSFAEMERLLRELEERRLLDEKQARQEEAERRRLLVMQELEAWLAAIVADRPSRPSA